MSGLPPTEGMDAIAAAFDEAYETEWNRVAEQDDGSSACGAADRAATIAGIRVVFAMRDALRSSGGASGNLREGIQRAADILRDLGDSANAEEIEGYLTASVSPEPSGKAIELLKAGHDNIHAWNWRDRQDWRESVNDFLMVQPLRVSPEPAGKAAPGSPFDKALGWIDTWLQVGTGPTAAERTVLTPFLQKYWNGATSTKTAKP